MTEVNNECRCGCGDDCGECRTIVFGSDGTVEVLCDCNLYVECVCEVETEEWQCRNRMICVARGAWRYRVWDGELREAFDGPALPAVEEDRAVQMWLQRQGWRLQFDPTDIVVNDFMVAHPEVDGDMVTRVFVESAEQWERIADVGFRA